LHASSAACVAEFVVVGVVAPPAAARIAFTHALRASEPGASPFALHVSSAACAAGLGGVWLPFAAASAALMHALKASEPGVSPLALHFSPAATAAEFVVVFVFVVPLLGLTAFCTHALNASVPGVSPWLLQLCSAD